MINIKQLEFKGFYENINKTYYPISPEEIFSIAYEPLIDIVYENSKLLKYSSKYSFSVRTLSKDKYLDHIRKIRNKLIARFSIDGVLHELKVSPRGDKKLLGALEGKNGVFIRKIPAAILLESEQLGILVLREARFYSNRIYYGEFVIRSLDDLLKLGKGPTYGLIEEPLVLLLPDLIGLNLKVISNFYKPSNLPFVEEAFMYIRPFYPLLYSEIINIGKELARKFVEEFIKREIKYGVIIGDFDESQIAISYDRGVIVTDPEFAYIMPSDKKYLRKLMGLIERYLSIDTKVLWKLYDDLKENIKELKGYIILKQKLETVKNVYDLPRFVDILYNS